jgi:hypothetical protein
MKRGKGKICQRERAYGKKRYKPKGKRFNKKQHQMEGKG